MEHVTARELAERYPVFFLDAYGVIIDGSGVVSGAPEFLADLQASGRPYYLLTNDASKLPSTYVERFGPLGLPLSEDNILTSGSLLEAWFKQEGLADARCLVLGPPDSERYVKRAQGRVLSLGRAQPEDVEVIVVGDEAGFPFVETLDLAITAAITRLDRGQPLKLVCPNPDLIYPKGEGAFGMAAGSIARLIEGTLAVRFPDGDPPHFAFLGKPHPPIFEAACRRAGTRNVVMMGDQIATDIRGANRAGLTAALVSWGLTGPPSRCRDPDDQPAFFVERW